MTYNKVRGIDCDECQGSGECSDCGGAHDPDCPTCDGSGECTECEGTGTIGYEPVDI